MSDNPITPEDAKALADKVIDQTVVPKKVPDVDDVEGQAKTLSGALASALMTASDFPVNVPPAVVGTVAAQLVAYGIRQTDRVDPDAIYAPAWITDGIKEQAMPVPESPKHTEAEPVVARTATAPEPPTRIPRKMRAVRQ